MRFSKYLIIIILSQFLITNFVFAKTRDTLSVKGNKFYNNGKEVQLRGVAVGDSYARKIYYQRSGKKDFEWISKNWKANTIRISVHPGIYLRNWKKAKNILKEEVSAARSNGLFVVIDWHVIGRPDGWYKEATDTMYTYESDFDLALKFWQEMSTIYKNDGGVIFEIWNEPMDINKDLSWEEMKPYWQDVIDMIRNNKAENVILVPGVYWAYDLRDIKNDPIIETNIAYSWHVYNQFPKYASMEAALDGLDQKYLVMITEWGSGLESDIGYDKEKGEYKFLDQIKNIITEKKLSYTAWCWHGSWRPSMFKNKWTELTRFGLLVKDFILYPEKVVLRLEADKNKNIASSASNKIKLAAQISTEEKNKKEKEFKLRVDSYIQNGGDTTSAKLGKIRRQQILETFRSAFGHEPSNENEWQDLILISNGKWPGRTSNDAEAKAIESFVNYFGRHPNLNNKADKHAIKVIAYGLVVDFNKTNIKKEKEATKQYIKKANAKPAKTADFNIVKSLAYSGAKYN